MRRRAQPFLLSIPLWCDCDKRRVLDKLQVLSSFQSHYGAIATTPSQSMRPSPALYISIPLWCDCDAAEHLSGVGRGSFNPTMVRLRPVRGRGGHRNHRVSIPLWCDCDPLPKVARRRAPKFQSHYGAIATKRRRGEVVVANVSVSIPLWCDCDKC